MKRLLGYIIAGVGAVATLIGAYHVLIGESMRVIVGGFRAMYIGLAGVALLVLGLVAARD